MGTGPIPLNYFVPQLHRKEALRVSRLELERDILDVDFHTYHLLTEFYPG
jgi:hypothetical protein